MSWTRHPLTLLLITGLLFGLGGCSDKPNAAPSGKKRPASQHLVEVVALERRFVTRSHVRTGSLRNRRIVRIHSQEEGRITTLPYYEGDWVNKDQVLAQLDDALLQAKLDKAKATTRQARIDLKRLQGLVKRRAASEDAQVRAETALQIALAEQKLLQTRLGFTRIEAPFDGIISQRRMELGDLAVRNSHLLTLIDPNSLVIDIYLSELLLPQIKRGDAVNVRIDALGQQEHPGKILRIHPELDPVTRQGLVEVTMEPIPSGARAGQFARVTLETARTERILAPFTAVRRDREGEFVYRLSDDNRAIRTPITSGIRIHDKIEILHGIEPGQRIISRGFLGLSENKKVKPVIHPG